MGSYERQNNNRLMEFDTINIAGRDRYGLWQDFCRASVLPQDCVAKPGDFSASFRSFSGGGVSIMRLNVSACEVIREPNYDSGEQHDHLVFYLVLAGKVRIEQDGRSTIIGPGDGTLCAGDRSFRLTAPSEHSVLSIKLPRSHLSRPQDLAQVTASSFLQAGAAAPLAINFINGVWNQIGSLSPEQIDRLMRTFVDIAETTLGLFDARYAYELPSSRQATVRRIKRFVEENISNEELTPLLVSQALGLSNRYMNRLLNDEGTALARYIWECRLHRAAQLLADPMHAYASISTIAYSLGFKSLSHFSTAFRERHRITPTEFRNERRNTRQ